MMVDAAQTIVSPIEIMDMRIAGTDPELQTLCAQHQKCIVSLVWKDNASVS